MNYQEMDQSTWMCYEFPDKSYYYGQVSYLDQSGVILSKDNVDAANNPKNKLVKHGFGIYIYKANDGQTTKYEGYWDRDKKQGQGKLTIPGELIYEGTFKDGCYHEHGKMNWNNGDIYDGNWKKNRMEGGGIFKHHEGFTLKGSFRANYYIDNEILRNPQMNQKEYQLFKKQRKEIIKQKEKNQKVIHGFVKKINIEEIDKLHQLCQKSNKNNRVPLIVASQGANFNLKTLLQTFQQKIKCQTFDLRKAYLLQGQEKYNYKQQFSEMTRRSLTQGELLLLNLDESQIAYNEAFYPDLKEFYDSKGFNTTTWNRELLQREEVYNKLPGVKQVHEKYMLVVWSKVKLSESLKEDRIREKLQLRFETILPFIKIDIIFITSNPV